MKYRPDFPDRFGGLEDSHAFCHRFLPWYIIRYGWVMRRTERKMVSLGRQ